MNLDINQKIEGIMQSNALADLSLKFLPPVTDSPDNYYFISYSHLDYKAVYADIYALQAEGVNVWYDRAMPAGESWKETAEKYIRPSRCAGVVFYISENSLLSPAIHEEIAFAKKCGKSCLTVNLPMQDGKSRSAKEMLDTMRANGANIAEDKYSFITTSFDNDVLYLPYSSTAEHKAEKILKLKKQPVLKIEKDEFNRVLVVSVNDNEIRRITLNDLIYTDVRTGNVLNVTGIADCAFANCRNLEYVELPPTIQHVDRYAFFCCKSLKTINLSNTRYIGEFSFAGCSSLQAVNLQNNSDIYDETFAGCSSLRRVELGNRLETIGIGAFRECAIEEIIIPDSVTSLGKMAFMNCVDIKRIDIGEKVVSIGEMCFSGCCAVHSLYLGESVKEIGIEAFDFKSGDFNSIKVSKQNSRYNDAGNCLVDKKDRSLILGCNSSVIPNDSNLRVIATKAFANCRLTRVNIPSCIKQIQKHAFENCAYLKALDIENIASWCQIDIEFYEDNPLINGCGLYLNGELVTNLTIPPSVETVRAGAFGGCSSLTSVTFSQGTKSILWWAFKQCQNLTCLNIPDSIEIFDSGVLEGSDNVLYNIYGNCKYLGNQSNPYLVLISILDRNLKSCKIHPETKVIASSAFMGCGNLEEVIVPEGVKTIGAHAFFGCCNAVITLPGSIERLEREAFNMCKKMLTVNLTTNLKYIGAIPFDCADIIYYNGSYAQWLDIDKSSEWNNEKCSVRYVVCNDYKLMLD